MEKKQFQYCKQNEKLYKDNYPQGSSQSHLFKAFDIEFYYLSNCFQMINLFLYEFPQFLVFYFLKLAIYF